MIKNIAPIILFLALFVAPLWGQEASDFRAAAERGDKDAQYNLGLYYDMGLGVARDCKQAVYWFTKAANQGLAEAQNDLGACYSKGKGVAQDYKQAVYWFTKAANQGHATAQCNLGGCYDFGHGVAQDKKQAVYWHTKAANQGYAMAQFVLGVHYYNGEGVAQDYKQAVYWYTKAANQGIKEAQFNLGCCYDDGEGVAQDYKQAVYWYTKAAEQGSAWAQLNLGGCYYFGKGVDKSCKTATYWFKQAKANGLVPTGMQSIYMDAAEECAKKETTIATQTSTSSSSPRSPVTQPSATTSTPTYSSTSTSSSSYTSSYRYRWPSYYEDIEGGFQVSYTQRSLRLKRASDGEVKRIDMLGVGEWSSGLSVGFHYNPRLFGWFGLHTGLFFEMSYETWDAPSDHYDCYFDLSLYAPVNLTMRIPFNDECALYLRGGMGFDLGLYAEEYDSRNTYIQSFEEPYGEEGFINRFNASWEYGVSLRLYSVMLHFTWHQGFLGHPTAIGARTTMDKVTVGMSFLF